MDLGIHSGGLLGAWNLELQARHGADGQAAGTPHASCSFVDLPRRAEMQAKHAQL